MLMLCCVVLCCVVLCGLHEPACLPVCLPLPSQARTGFTNHVHLVDGDDELVDAQGACEENVLACLPVCVKPGLKFTG